MNGSPSSTKQRELPIDRETDIARLQQIVQLGQTSRERQQAMDRIDLLKAYAAQDPLTRTLD